MSDSDSNPSSTPGPASSPPPPPPPTEALPSTEPLPPIQVSDEPGAPILPPSDTTPVAGVPTTAVPVTPAATTAMPTAAGAVPPIYPPDGTLLDDADDEPTPWYKKPGPIALMVVIALAGIGLILWLVLGGDDDDKATAESSRLIIELSDETGQPVDSGFVATVTGPADAPTAFVWIRPVDAPTGPTTGDATGTDGRVDFEWEADDTVADPQAWTSTLTLLQGVPAGWTAQSPIVDCVLDRPDEQQSVVAMNVSIDSPDVTIDRAASYTFPNYQFVPGDTVTCKIVGISPPIVVDTTTVDTTTVETTVVETTVPETTPTTETPATTEAPATTEVPPTSVPVVTVPEQPDASLWDVIDVSPDLSELKSLIQLADLQSTLEDPAATLTLFAPSNDAIALARTAVGGPDLNDPAVVRDLLLAHVDTEKVLMLADLKGVTEVPVANGGPQPVDSKATPPTIGTDGAKIVVPDVTAANGVIHVIDRMLTPQP